MLICKEREGYFVSHTMHLCILRAHEKPHIHIRGGHSVAKLHIGAQMGKEEQIAIYILILEKTDAWEEFLQRQERSLVGKMAANIFVGSIVPLGVEQLEDSA